MMAIALVAGAALAVLGVLAGEVSEMPFARRKADAGRSRVSAPPQRARILL